MKNFIRNRQFSEEDVLSIERTPVPSSSQLQKNIIKLTKELPQYTDNTGLATVYNLSAFLDKVGLKKHSFSIGFKPYAASIAAGFAVIALSSTLWMPSQNEQIVEDYTSMNAEKLAEEIEWQDLMLLNDEIAFAGL